MKPDLDPITIEALARAHQQHVLDTYKLYGQRDGIDQPEWTDRLPLTGLQELFARHERRRAKQGLARLAFEVLLCAVISLVVVAIVVIATRFHP